MEIPNHEVLLPIACAIGGVFGSLTQAMVATIHADGPPNELGILKMAPPELKKIRGAWLSMRLLIGGVLGFVFALYFIGALNNEVGTFARIWALSFGVGYAAPKIWAAQDKVLIEKIGESESSPSRSDG